MFHKRIVCSYLYTITKYGYPPPSKDVIRHIQEMRDLGFQSIELEGVREQHLLEMHELRHEVKDCLKSSRLHLPFFCAVLPGLTSPHREHRQKQLKLFERGCEIANALGANGILDNAPLPPFVFPDDIPLARHYDERVLSNATLPDNLSWKEFWTYLVDTLREACDIAAGHKLSYHLHPSIGVLASGADGFLYLSDAVQRENLRFVLDTANQFAMKENLSICARRLAPFIDYIHLSDNRGTRVEHLRVGDGAINWRSLFDALSNIGYHGHFGIDVGGPESAIKALDDAYVSSATWLETQLDSPIHRKEAHAR